MTPPSQLKRRRIEPIVSGYAIQPPGDDDAMHVEIARVGEIIDGVFDFDADVWAIRYMQRCLNRDGFWEWEPLPSSRSAAFKTRTRWTCKDALRAAREAVIAGNWPGGPELRWKSYEEEFDAD